MHGLSKPQGITSDNCSEDALAMKVEAKGCIVVHVAAVASEAATVAIEHLESVPVVECGIVG